MLSALVTAINVLLSYQRSFILFAPQSGSSATDPEYTPSVELSQVGFSDGIFSENDFVEIKIKENTKQIVPICLGLSKPLHVCVCVCV